MDTIEKKRAAILVKRIKTINNFIIENLGTNKTFGEYLSSLGINEAIFMKDLPPFLVVDGISKANASSGNLMDYGRVLNLHLFNQKLMHDSKINRSLSADAQDLSEGVVPANYLDYNATGSTDGDIMELAKKMVIESGKFKGLTLINWNQKTGITNLNSNERNQINQDYNKYYNEINSRTKKLTPEEFDGSLKTALKDTFKDAGQSIKGSIKGAVQGVGDQLPFINKFNPVTVLMRGAFLSLLAINAAALASVLKSIKNDKDQTHWNKIKNKWNKLGGEIGKLESTINNGSNHKPFPKIKKKTKSADGSEEELDPNDGRNAGKIAAGAAAALVGLAGVLATNPATAAASVNVGAAAGVLATISPILKQFAKSKGEDTSGIPDLPKVSIDPDTDAALADDTLSNFYNNYKGWIIGILAIATIGTIFVVVSGEKK
jgi:hypothetical protein